MLEYVDISEKVQFFIFEFLFGNFQLVLQGMNFLQKEIFHSCKKWFMALIILQKSDFEKLESFCLNL